MTKLLNFVLRNGVVLVACVLYIAAFVFFVRAQSYRAELKQSDTDQFKAGDLVTIVDVIDGDEIAVTNKAGARTVVRLLGIKSFSPTINDVRLAQFGKICFEHLRNQHLNASAQITPGATAVDKHGRLLAYVHVQGDGKAYDVDIAAGLLREGLTQVYTRYDFERMVSYLELEQAAIAAKTGLWGHEQARLRATAFKDVWDGERRGDD